MEDADLKVGATRLKGHSASHDSGMGRVYSFSALPEP
jgi:hypothetical protein